jgi:hypothetical protein
MAAIDIAREAPERRAREAEYREYRLTYWGVFIFFLTVALVLRLTPRRVRRKVPGLAGSRSPLTEARVATSSCIPFAYR